MEENAILFDRESSRILSTEDKAMLFHRESLTCSTILSMEERAMLFYRQSLKCSRISSTEEKAMLFHRESLTRNKISKEIKSAEPNKTLRHCYQRVTKYRRLRD
jgi:hypothetical protein